MIERTIGDAGRMLSAHNSRRGAIAAMLAVALLGAGLQPVIAQSDGGNGGGSGGSNGGAGGSGGAGGDASTGGGGGGRRRRRRGRRRRR